MAVTTIASRTMTMQAENDPTKGVLCAVLDEGRIALVRVVGRGTFANSMGLKQFADRLQRPDHSFQFIIDLDQCETMDSTFMGVMAGIAITHQRLKQPKPIVVNASDQCRKLLKNLGLTHLLEMRSGDVAAVKDGEAHLAPAVTDQAGKVDHICMTLQAHKNLVSIDGANEVRFQAVIEYLEKNLEQEGGKCGKSAN